MELSLHTGLKMVMRNAGGSSEQQIKDIEYLVGEGIDLLIVTPNEAKPLTPIVKKVYAQGIPVVVVDRKIESDDYTAYVGGNNYNLGVEAGKIAGRLLNYKGKIVEIWGMKGSTPAIERHNGFIKGIENYKDISIIYSETGEWSEDGGRKTMEKALNELDSCDLVFSHNDFMAIGAHSVVKKKCADRNIKFVSIDGLAGEGGGIQAVMNGIIDVTLLYPTGGEQSVQIAYKILNKQAYERDNILNTIQIDTTNAVVINFQTEHVLSMQRKIEKQISVLQNLHVKFQGQRTFLIITSIFLILVAGLSVLLFRAFRNKKRANKLLSQQKKEIENQKLQIEEGYRNQQLLSSFGQRITATLNFETISDMLYEYVSKLMDTSVFGIGLHIPEMKALRFPSSIDNGKKLSPLIRKLNTKNSLAIWSFNNSKEVFINNAEQEYSKYISEKPVLLSANPPRSIILLPLNVEERKIGIIAVNSMNENAYTEKDLTTLRTLASYTAIALDNSNAYRTIKAKNENIKASIGYAQTIQKAFLPLKKEIDKDFENFVLYHPRDIVSGDFFWYAKENENTDDEMSFVAVVDCTGHGVPGAFMSMIGINLLNEIVRVKKIYEPQQILDLLNIGITKALKQKETDNDDGMDVCLCKIEKRKNKENKIPVTFAGAKRPLAYFDKEEKVINVIKGDIYSIGGQRDYHTSYKQTELSFNSGDMIYMTSDGYVDQNNSQRKSFTSKKLFEILKDVASLPEKEQNEKLEAALVEHSEGQLQRDDITLLGIRL